MDKLAATTLMKMLESVPDQLQEGVVEHMRDYIEDIRDEAKWRESFFRTNDRLIVAAQQARQKIADGKGCPLDIDKL